MTISHRARQLVKTLLPIPIAAALAALLLLAGCGGAGVAASGGYDLSATTTIRVHYPSGALTLRGDQGGLSWSKGVALKSAGGVFTYTSKSIKKRAQFKPLLGDVTWSRGPNYAVDPGASVDVWPRFQSDTGTVQRIDGWYSNTLQDSRPIWIYYPPSYAEQSSEPFPVVYMHDGQNLFDPAYSFAGVIWNIQGAMNQGAADGSIREAIVVGIGNDANRIWEYTPDSDPDYAGGGAPQYLDFVINELKPQIDQNLRTEPDRLDTAMIGSSLGGLVTAVAGVWHPDVFGLVGVMSPSTWWNNDEIIGMVSATAPAAVKPARVYVDSGDSGASNDDVTETAQLAQAYRNLGSIDVGYTVGHGDQHNETAWAKRVPGALRDLLGPRPALP